MVDSILGVTLAAVMFFVWSAISWMALPWQRGVFRIDVDVAAFWGSQSCF